MNIEKVGDKLYRGPRPTKFLDELVSAKVSHIISLEWGFVDLADGSLYNLNVAAFDRGIFVHCLPLSDFSSPTFEQTSRIINFIEICKIRGESVYVCCKRGKDRTGWIVAAYQIVFEKRPIEIAIAGWVSRGHDTRVYFWWRDAFRKIIKRLGK